MECLLNGEHPRNLGRSCSVPDHLYAELVDFIQESLDNIELKEPADDGYGWLHRLDGRRREQFQLPDDVGAVAYWHDADDRDSPYELREMTSAEADAITAECEHVRVTAVNRYYHERGGKDDGHPAYAIYALHRARAKRARADAAGDAGDTAAPA